MAGSTRTKTGNVAPGAELPETKTSRASAFREGDALAGREVMDIRQAAEYLGISPDSLYKYASENFIPAFRLGNRWRFKRSLMESWMERQSALPSLPAQEKVVKHKQKKPSGRVR
jgi:excisionase family DNA binding protein